MYRKNLRKIPVWGKITEPIKNRQAKTDRVETQLCICFDNIENYNQIPFIAVIPP